MRKQSAVRLLVGSTLMALVAAGAASLAQAPLAVRTGRVSIAGTSNVHSYTASTTKVQVTETRIAALPAGTEFWEHVLKPGAVQAFAISIPAATLASPKGDLDKNMLKALKVHEFPDITFRLLRVETKDTPVARRAIGILKIAGVEREVAMAITTRRTGETLTVAGTVDLLMSDYGITPPKAMMGMLKTDDKVTVTFETVLTIPTT
jgi:polyisoprenoid-binding protein YceI